MAEIEAVSLVRFVPRTDEVAYIRLVQNSQNSSFVGRIGGAQNVNLTTVPPTFVIVHELLHVLGLWHEHQRPDRDQFIEVIEPRIIPEFAFNFAIVPDSHAFGPFDFDSVMHYGQCAFSQCGTACFDNAAACRTIEVLPPFQNVQSLIGQRTHLSTGDIAAINALYDAPFAPALPFADTFASGGLDTSTWITSHGTAVALCDVPSASPPFAVRLPANATLETGVIDASSLGAVTVDLAIRRPHREASTSLIIEHRTPGIDWEIIDTFTPADIPGAAFAYRTIVVAGDALHANLRLRARVIDASPQTLPDEAWWIDDFVIDGAPRPANDACQMGTPVNAGTSHAFDLGGAAASDFAASCRPDDVDVWYRFVTPGGGRATISGCDASDDVAIALFGPACPNDQTVPISCATMGCGLGAVVSAEVAGTSLFWIRVSGPRAASGTVAISFGPVGAPDGACCLDDGTCLALPPTTCSAAGGVPQDDGTSCDDVSCPPLVGACCVADGSCVSLTIADCTSIAGVFSVDQSCDAVPCNVEIGGCCLDAAECQVMTFDHCAHAGGLFVGTGSTCLGVACEAFTCRGDCAPAGGDGVVDIDDLLLVIQSINAPIGDGPSACDIAPINPDGSIGNGAVGIDDLIAVLNQFGQCG
jgi:hypothetical protein